MLFVVTAQIVDDIILMIKLTIEILQYETVKKTGLKFITY